MGLQYALDSDSKKFLAYTTEFEFAPGLAIYDFRSIGRVCNLDASNKITLADINELFVEMSPFIPSALFVNKAQWLAIQAIKTSALATIPGDRELFLNVLTINGVPVFIDDSITQTEAVIA